MQTQIAGIREQAGRGASSAIESVLWQCGHASPSAQLLPNLHAAASGLHEPEWGALLGLTRRHGMAPLVFQNTAVAGLLPAMPAEIYASLKHLYSTNLIANRRTSRELNKIIQRTSEDQIPVIVLKGVTLEARYYGTIGLRQVGDIDLLVHAEDIARTVDALSRLGYQPMAESTRDQADTALKFREVKLLREGGFAVELHWTLSSAPPYDQRLSVDDAWLRVHEETCDGRQVLVLDPADDLLFLSVHCTAQHTDERLIWLVDIAELVQARHHEWDWAAITQRAIGHGVAMPLAVALTQAQARLGVQVPSDALEQLWQAAATPWERKAWSAARSPFASIARLWYYFASLQDPADKLLLLSYLGRHGLQQLLRRLQNTTAARRFHAVPPHQ